MELLEIGKEIKFSFDNFSSEYDKIKKLSNEAILDSYYENLFLKLIKINDSHNEKIYIFDGNAIVYVNFKEKKYKFKLCVGWPSLHFCLYEENNNRPYEFLKDSDGYKYSPDYFFSIFLGVEKKYNPCILL